MRNLLLAAGVLALNVGTAAGQDQVYDWAGAYIGLQAGHGWGDADHVTHSATLFPFTHNDIDGFVGGAYVGFNHQFPNKIIVSVEGDIAWTNLQGGPDLSVNAAGIPDGAATAETDVEWTGAVRARLGYSVGRVLPYIAGGLAIAKADTNSSRGMYNGQVRDVLAGWTLGGGAEYAATDQLVMRLEYRYSDFGRASATTYPPVNALQSLDLKTHDVRFGIAYKF
ncbi:outer membrane immunogenic protein [Aminobacter niigataensis]|uniref:Outer membrane immunogenic protein n=1 Tax=Aminobacter niigataensis TaxID=83265 RepID=A0ABR6KYF8_9HYPH|nr:outer membrane protein [Aminobacter niigataensis]MBB4649554.1 outer membrane immunogenic protein [Aminobacter niigataensis]